MVKLIMGLKGSGKTKQLVDLVKKAVEEDRGAVVCIEKDKNLTYDIPYTARLIQAGEYNINTNALLRGFVMGLHAGNYDICHVFIDNFYKMLDDASDDAVVAFLADLDAFSSREGVDFTISVTADPDAADPRISKYF